MRATEETIDSIVNSSRIPSGRSRREIQRELQTHIEDFVLAAREAGHDQDEIEKLVLANFGKPAEIAEGFAWVYRQERRRTRALTYTFSTVLIASCLAAAVLAAQAGLALGFGNPVRRVIASRHAAMEALDILASVAVYLGLISLENVFQKHRFQKAALLLAMILTAVTMSSAAAGFHLTFLSFGLINGVFSRALQLFVARKLARFGIVAVCFPLAGLAMALQWAPGSQIALAATCASWFVMGFGYQLMTHFAVRVDSAVLSSFERN